MKQFMLASRGSFAVQTSKNVALPSSLAPDVMQMLASFQQQFTTVAV
jgi:hypothetical protein